MFDPTDIYPVHLPGVEGARYLDPLAVRRDLLVATSGRCWEWARQARQLADDLAALGDAATDEAAAQRAEWSARQAELEGPLAGAAVRAFGLAPLDPETGFGFTETTALGLLYDYLGWLEGKGGRPGV